MARVLVGIPTWNRPRMVRESVQSVLDQSFDDFRLVVSDNHSPEAVCRDIEAFLGRVDDRRVSFHRQPRNGGEYGQGRFLFSECHEEFFVILHDDDRMEPGHLAFAVDVLDNHPEVDFVSTSQYLFDETGRRLPERTVAYHREVGRDRLAEGRLTAVLETLLDHGGVFSISGSVFRSRAIHECGLVDPDCEGRFPFEFNVFLRLAERGKSAYVSQRELIGYRWHPGSMRNESPWYFNEEMVGTLLELLERRRFSGAAERKRRRLLAITHRNFGYIMLSLARPGASYQSLFRSVRLDPLSVKNWLYLGFALAFPFLVPRFWGPRVTAAGAR